MSIISPDLLHSIYYTKFGDLSAGAGTYLTMVQGRSRTGQLGEWGIGRSKNLTLPGLKTRSFRGRLYKDRGHDLSCD